MRVAALIELFYFRTRLLITDTSAAAVLDFPTNYNVRLLGKAYASNEYPPIDRINSKQFKLLRSSGNVNYAALCINHVHLFACNYRGVNGWIFWVTCLL